MTILFNGRIGHRQYRLLIFRIDGKVYGYRPYVGYIDFVKEMIDHERIP